MTILLLALGLPMTGISAFLYGYWLRGRRHWRTFERLCEALGERP